MRRAQALVSLIAIGCTPATPNSDEVGESESESESAGDEVATFTTTATTSTDGDGDGDSTSESTESSETGTAGTSESTTDTSESTTDTSESTTDTGTETGTETGTDTTQTTDGMESTTGDEPPFVTSTNPANDVTGIAPDTTIDVTFSEVMDPATVTTNVADESCSGTVQVSADDFATCVRMAADPFSGDDQGFTLTPAAALSSTTTYRIRVLAQVTDAGGTAMLDDFTTNVGFQIRYFHTITIDGVNDFTSDETFGSSSLGHTGYVAWDDAFVYLGMNSPDLANNSNQVWWVAYLGGPMGTSTGVLYNTQQPNLPFAAQWHLRWKASDDYGGALEWTGMNWVDPGFGPIAGSDDVGVSGSFVEVRVALSDLANPDLLGVHMGMLREQAFNEACWAAIPGNSYVDGYDPDYSHWYEFDLLGSNFPADHPPM